MAASAVNEQAYAAAAGATAGTAEWNAWYSEYLIRATGQSAKTLELSREVLECVSRGDLEPTALQDRYPDFAKSRGTDYGSQLAVMTGRFLDGLVRLGATYSAEQAELVVPGASFPDIRPPLYNPLNPTSWMGELTDFAARVNQRAVKAYQTHSQLVSSGQTSPERLQHAVSDYYSRRLPGLLSELGKLYFEMLGCLNDLRAQHEEEYLNSLLAEAHGERRMTEFVLELKAEQGGSASVSLAVDNTSPERAIIACKMTDVRRADGIGPAFSPALTVNPEEVELAPQEETSLRLTAYFGDEYDVDMPYTGTIVITGNGEPRLEVPLRLIATSSQ